MRHIRKRAEERVVRKKIMLLATVLALGAVAALGGAAIPASAQGGVNFVLDSVLRVNPEEETVTVPVYRGTFAGSQVHYIVTESSNKEDAERRKVNYTPKLANALGTRAVQKVTRANGVVDFSGTVRFASTRSLRAGSDGTPPGTTPPPSEGDANYSPLITTGNGTVLNASQVANTSGVHDSLVSLDLGKPPAGFPNAAGEVTLGTFGGFYDGSDLLYLHMDGSSLDIATIEGSTFAPNLNSAPGLGSNDRETSARSAIIPIENGIEPRNDPERQGLQSFLANQGDPLNVTQTFPGKGGDRYSPVWDVHILRWTEEAIAAGERRRLDDDSEVVDEFEEGNLVSTGTGPPNPSLGGIRANNAISNCPIVIELPSVNPGQRGAPQENR
jgi:hypothetical protein